jgi:hypothetical protein
MATKTIPEYLEDERRNRADTELRTEEETERIQSLHHGHHHTQKSPKPESPAAVEAVGGEGHAPPKSRDGKPAGWREDPCMTRADRGDPYSLNYWTNPVHKTGAEASAGFDGHDLFVKILPR